jgi:hypothetical protein
MQMATEKKAKEEDMEAEETEATEKKAKEDMEAGKT